MPPAKPMVRNRPSGCSRAHGGGGQRLSDGIIDDMGTAKRFQLGAQVERVGTAVQTDLGPRCCATASLLAPRATAITRAPIRAPISTAVRPPHRRPPTQQAFRPAADAPDAQCQVRCAIGDKKGGGIGEGHGIGHFDTAFGLAKRVFGKPALPQMRPRGRPCESRSQKRRPHRPSPQNSMPGV